MMDIEEIKFSSLPNCEGGVLYLNFPYKEKTIED